MGGAGYGPPQANGELASAAANRATTASTATLAFADTGSQSRAIAFCAAGAARAFATLAGILSVGFLRHLSLLLRSAPDFALFIGADAHPAVSLHAFHKEI
jgi:hypothetical protein